MRETNNSENELKLVSTSDGSNTIYNPLVGENYHSRHGALQESRHVFLNSGLKFFLENNAEAAENLSGNGKRQVSILEVGFGTGLNFLLSADYCRTEDLFLQYTGIEAWPLRPELIFHTGYDQYISGETWNQFKTIYQDALQQNVLMNENSSLEISATTLQSFETIRQYDVVYFDAFAAVHQPEMWTTEAIANCTRYLKKGGVFVTYAITGNLKRSMKSLGFSIEKAPGAPGKREMLRAVKNQEPV